MWAITSLNPVGLASENIYSCDGLPILDTVRGPEGSKYRIIVGSYGYLDIEDTGHQTGGPHYWTLLINGDQTYWYDGQGSLALSVSSQGAYELTGDGNSFTGVLKPLPTIAGETLTNFVKMIDMKIVPYQNPPSGTPKSVDQLTALGKQYYGESDPYSFYKAMCLYDWTSASFIRQDLFHQLQYTEAEGNPLDLTTMAQVIYGCNYPGYTHVDANFMNQFTLKPVSTEAELYQALLGVYETVKPLAISEMNLQIMSLLTLPKPTVAAYPQLYRGAMPMSGGYDTSDFAPSLFEFPGNANTTVPLKQSLADALNGILSDGNVITTKGPWSFSNDLDGAKVWQNGILITCNPPEGATVWPGCADITPFSLNPDTFEINVPPVTRYRIDSYEWITINDKPVCHFTMTMLGYCVEPY